MLERASNGGDIDRSWKGGTAIDEAMTRKPKGHDFVIERRGAKPAAARHMSMTGG